jgi:hypothetical protein
MSPMPYSDPRLVALYDALAYFGERDHRFRFNVISESGGR